MATIRKADVAEAGLLSDLAFRSKAYWGYSSNFMESCRAELTCSPEDFDKAHFYVAETNHAVVGFYALILLSPTEIELEALFVEPSAIGQGYGRALIEHAKTTARGLGASVMMIQGDPNASDFYLAAGGELTGERESGSIPGRFLPTFAIQLDQSQRY